MKIRDDGSEEIFDIPLNGFEILADDGRSLYSLRMNSKGILEISVIGVCKHHNTLLDDNLLISPYGTNSIKIARPEYKN